MQRKLLLVRHAQSVPQAGAAPAGWPLTEKGRRDAAVLAESMRPFRPAAIVTSHELKAKETGDILAGVLALPCTARDGLQEHVRPAPDRLGSQEEFEAAVVRLFEKPDELVFGLETARQALERFEAAVSEVLAAHPQQTVAVVSHGTVIALLVARYNGLDVKAFWQGLKMPDLIVLDLPGFKISKT